MTGTPVRVLVVDDQAPFRMAAGFVVGRAIGFEVVGQASSGEEALELIEQRRPDLVLMDINMGAMSGIDATRAVMTNDPDLTIFLCSTYARSDLPPGALDLAAAYINKEELTPDVLRALWDETKASPG